MPRFVVEWENGEIIRVWTWDKWLALPIKSRNWDSEVLEARDEIDAYMQVTRGANQ